MSSIKMFNHINKYEKATVFFNLASFIQLIAFNRELLG